MSLLYTHLHTHAHMPNLTKNLMWSFFFPCVRRKVRQKLLFVIMRNSWQRHLIASISIRLIGLIAHGVKLLNNEKFAEKKYTNISKYDHFLQNNELQTWYRLLIVKKVIFFERCLLEWWCKKPGQKVDWQKKVILLAKRRKWKLCELDTVLWSIEGRIEGWVPRKHFRNFSGFTLV